MEDDFEQALREKLGGAYEEKIAEKVSEFGGLLTRRAAVRILCKENGISLEQALPLKEALKSRVPFSFSARVERVFPVQEYQNSRDRSVRLHVSDREGDATLVLWNEQIAHARAVSAGDTVECAGAYSRAGEISVGKSGKIAFAKARQLAKIGTLKEGICSLECTVREASLPRAFLDRKTSEERKMLPFTACQGGECVRAVIWLSKGDASPPVISGDTVLIEDAVCRNGELHLNSFSRLSTVSSGSQLQGKLESISASGAKIAFTIDGREFSCGLSAGLEMLGIASIPDGVSAETIVSLKASELSGKSAIYFCSGNNLLKLKFEN